MKDREKLVELIGTTPCVGFSSRTAAEHIADHLITNGVTLNQWIPVTERLPEEYGTYLIFTTQYFTPDHIDEIDHRDGIEISGYYNGYGFMSKNGMYAKYWTFLPQPPKGD